MFWTRLVIAVFGVLIGATGIGLGSIEIVGHGGVLLLFAIYLKLEEDL